MTGVAGSRLVELIEWFVFGMLRVGKYCTRYVGGVAVYFASVYDD